MSNPTAEQHADEQAADNDRSQWPYVTEPTQPRIIRRVTTDGSAGYGVVLALWSDGSVTWDAPGQDVAL